MKIVTSEQMRRIEQECADMGLPPEALMENAGRAVADQIVSIVGDLRDQRILLLIGPGNNGGDGLVAARWLVEKSADYLAYVCGPREKDRSLRSLTKVAYAANDRDFELFESYLANATIVIDALFGTGKMRPLDGVYQQVLERVDRVKEEKPEMQLFAVDLPSGLNPDNGTVDPATICFDHTITLGLPKVGLYTFPGREFAGEIAVVDIGIPPEAVNIKIDLNLMDAAWAASLLPARPLSANKGTFGKAMVAAGSINYTGAAYLACSGAMRVGAGLVTLATPAGIMPVLVSKLTETTFLPLPESKPGIVSAAAVDTLLPELKTYNALLVGCGLGRDPSASAFITNLLSKNGLPPLILDADALNALAGKSGWYENFKTLAVLTPHPGEMARLAGMTVDQIQADRVEITRRKAREWNKVIVLKGAHSVVASPEGETWISAVANPGLASAGTGDVLAGAIAGLAAQGLSLFEAASLGVYLHALAGEIVYKLIGDAGMIASDLLPALPQSIKEAKNAVNS